MTLTNLINRECVIVRRSESGTLDELGNDIPTETEVESVCEIQQRKAAEEDDQGEVSDTLWAGYFLPGTALGTGDTVVVEGGEYELVGEPWVARNPRTQAVSHLEATLRRTAGSEDS